MFLLLAALTGTAFGTGVIVGLAVGASSVACVYAGRKALRAVRKRGLRVLDQR
jgi:hypothetical protein